MKMIMHRMNRAVFTAVGLSNPATAPNLCPLRKEESVFLRVWGIGVWGICLCFFLSACNLTSDPVEITPEPTPDLPRAEILEPANNQQVIEGTEFTFDVVGRDENPGVARIELRIDDVTLDEVPPTEDEFVPVLRAQIPWRAAGVGLHVIEVIAYRPDGTPSDSAIINIEVVPRE